MPVINVGMLRSGSLQGADYGATISLILDESEPGQGPRLHRQMRRTAGGGMSRLDVQFTAAVERSGRLLHKLR